MLKPPKSEGADPGRAIVYRGVDDLRSARLQAVFAIWQSRCQGELLPSSLGFDILDYGSAMTNINLVAVRHDPLDFIFRVHSVKGAAYIGKDMTGLSVDDYPEPRYRDFVKAVFTAAASSRAAKVVVEDMFMTETRMLRWEGVVLPMQDAEGAVADLLVAFEVLQ